MERTVDALIDILQTLVLQYQALEEIEADKTSVIIERNAPALEELILQQEDIMRSIDESESRRQTVTAMIAETVGIPETSVSATELSSRFSEHRRDSFRTTVNSLREVMNRVRRLSQTNRNCLFDNIEFFNAVMSQLRESVSLDDGYSAGGPARRARSSAALFNRTV